MTAATPTAPDQPSVKTRRLSIAPQIGAYAAVKRVLWPYVMATAPPGYASDVVNIDSRGHRVTRLGTETARSDDAPENAAFLLGGSFSFGVGAANDSGTLAAQLWRRTGRPCVNLGIRAAVSAQELIASLPFVDRNSTFVVCSGLNNFSVGLAGTGLDPLFGPMYHESHLQRLSEHSISALGRLAGDPLGAFGDGALRRELRRRRRARIHERLRPVRRFRKRVRGRLASSSSSASKPLSARDLEPDVDELVASAAARQIRDLRCLQRLTLSTVVFALQPTAVAMAKDWTPEELELFALNDALQAQRWQKLKRMLEVHWATYARKLERECGGLGVPFIDLSKGRFEGWCFIDRAHMTDRGYAAVADLLMEVLPDRVA